MTAQVEFFCSPAEEREVIDYLTRDEDTVVFDVREGVLSAWNSFTVNRIPTWQDRFSVYLWRRSLGPLVWHTSKPVVTGSTHASFVANMFARVEWDERGLGDEDKLLNVDLSPILCYRRGALRNDTRAPNRILAPPSSLARAGKQYESWVKRSLAWIKRRSKLVHDWRNPSSIPNPDMLLNSTYAFPDAQLQLASGNHPFALFVVDGT